MIDLEKEELITLKEAANRLPGRPHMSALHRWRRGLADGRKLEIVKVGGRIFTTEEALQRFISSSGDDRRLEAQTKPQKYVESELDALVISGPRRDGCAGRDQPEKQFSRFP